MANEAAPSPRPGSIAVFVWLMVASIVATIAMTPALFSLLGPSQPAPFGYASGGRAKFIIGFSLANIVLSAVAIAVGLGLEPKVGAGVPLLRCWLAGELPRQTSRMLSQCIVIAFGLAALVLGCAVTFRTQLPALPDKFVFPPIWQGVLMMLGAAVREEILFRLLAINLFIWVAIKVCRQQNATPAIFWLVNVLVALMFAWMHLIPAAPLLDLNAIATGGAIVIGTLAGTLLGWVYWRLGLLMAMVTHAVSGVLIYLGGRGLIALLA